MLKKFDIKYIIIALGITALLFTQLVGCNQQVIDANYTFNKAIIDGIGTVEVRSWKDFQYSDMIQLTDSEGNVYLTHSSKVILIYED